MILLSLLIPVASAHRTIERIPWGDYVNLMHKLTSDQLELLDIVGRDPAGETVDVLVNDSGRNLLSKNDIQFREIKSSEDLRTERIDDRYYDYNDVTSALQTYESTYPSIAKRYNLGTTAEGRTIWAMKISDQVTADQPEPEILFIGLHEAREIMSTEITMDIIDYLLTHYSSSSEVQDWVNTWQIWIIPMLNPDGSAYCWSDDQYWIKNRHDFGNDVYGVDLAHNYPFAWASCFGSSSDPNSNSYHGTSAGSEPETQAVMELAVHHHFLAVLSYHSFNELVLMPYGCYGQNAPEKNILQNFGNSFGSLIQKDSGTTGYSTGSWWEMLYSNDGNETDYFYAMNGAMAYAIQVNASSYYPSYNMRDTTVQKQRPGWQKVLDLFNSGAMVYGTITDACTGEPVQAEFHFDEYPLTENETPHTSDPDTGKYYAIGRPGNMNLVVTAEGYLDRWVPVTLGSQAILKDIAMLPTDQAGLTVWTSQIDDSSLGDGDMLLDPGEHALLRVALLAPGLSVSGISATLSTTDPYLTVVHNSATWPDLNGGTADWCQDDCFEIAADSNAPDGHVATLTLTFQANETLCANTDTTEVTIQTYMYMCPFWGEFMDSDPGWTITSYPTQGNPPGPYHNWEFGEPLNGPGTAYTGSYVYGTDLSGNYDNNWTLCLTSPVIDCTDLTESTLNFARFLQVEDGYDHGRIRVRNSPSDSWHTIFDSYYQPGWTNDATWHEMELDISEYADNESYFQVRFDVRSDTSISLPGFYVDDVLICGNYHGTMPPQPTPTMRPTSTPTQNTSPTPTPQFTVTPPPNTGTPTPSPTVAPGTPTNTPITPTNTPTVVPPTSTATNTPFPTVTPTSPGNPTPTPTATWTTEPTNTPEPSATPTPPSQPTATYTPTPPATDSFLIELLLNQTYFQAGDEFALECHVARHGATVTVDQYILLDVGGVYFFNPSWEQTPDFETHTYYDGFDETTDILRFTWPTIEGHFNGIKFYGGCVYTGTADLIGDITMVEFAY